MAEYYNVTQEELESYIVPQGFKRIQFPRAIELVYAKRMDYVNGRKISGMPETSMILFSGINPDGNSRLVGRDAMRVEIAWAEPLSTAEFIERCKLFAKASEASSQPYYTVAHSDNPPSWVKWIARVGGSKRVHRVRGWKSNLQDRIDHWHDFLGPDCPQCGAPTRLIEPRKGKRFDPFYSCARYPACKGSVSIPKEERKR